MKYLSFFIFWSALIVGCNSSQQKAASETTKVETVQATTAEIPLPNVPIYSDFDEMAHIFNHENDTTYIINFWATWCKPCVEELPYFEDIHRDYSDKPVKVILVSLDFKKQIEKKLLPFIQKRNLQPTVMVLVDPDANSWIPKVDDVWDGAIPVTVVYNKNKREFIRRKFENHEELESILKSFL